MSEDISKMVGDFYDLEKQIKNNNDAVKNMKKDYKKLKESILDYMVVNNIQEMDTPDGKLIKKTSQSKSGINNDIIKEALDKMSHDNIVISNDTVAMIVNEINKTRKLSEKTMLHRSKKKQANN